MLTHIITYIYEGVLKSSQPNKQGNKIFLKFLLNLLGFFLFFFKL